MAYQEEEGTKLRRQSTKQAIALAMQGRWQEAAAVNKSLLEHFPEDVDAYNRLGRAYVELGDYSLAKEAYRKAMELDPFNSIAKKNLDRLAHLVETTASFEGGFHKVEPQQFIEEVGKAGVAGLYRLATPEVLAKLVAGVQVGLKIEGASLTVIDSRGEYLGQVEPKYALRLIKLMEGGNRYSAIIIISSAETVTVMIREIYQHPSQVGRLSFPPKGVEAFRPYVGDRIIRRELEYEQSLPGEPTYTIIGGEEMGEEIELLSEEASELDEETEDME